MKVRVRESRAKGFSKCNVCQYLKMKMRGTDNQAKRAAYERRLQKHVQMVYADREELARIQRLCMVDPHHAGFFLDAADSQKFSIPTTKSTAKMMSQLWRIKQKLTCVQMFDTSQTLFMFRTLPNVPTGGNLTCTILISSWKCSKRGCLTTQPIYTSTWTVPVTISVTRSCIHSSTFYFVRKRTIGSCRGFTC